MSTFLADFCKWPLTSGETVWFVAFWVGFAVVMRRTEEN